jgi:hypothetical protein
VIRCGKNKKSRFACGLRIVNKRGFGNFETQMSKTRKPYGQRRRFRLENPDMCCFVIMKMMET